MRGTKTFLAVLLFCLPVWAQQQTWLFGISNNNPQVAQPSDTFWDGFAHPFPNSQANALNFFVQSNTSDQGDYSWIQLQQTANNGTSWNYWSGTKVHRIAVTAIGSGYSSPTCSVNNPNGGTAATCTPTTVNGAIPSVTLSAGGSGYNVAGVKNAAVFTGGSCAVEPTAYPIAHAANSGAIAILALQTYGSGCATAPACAITTTGAGTGATCTAAAPVNGAITSVALNTQGSNYVQGPRVTIFGSPGAGAAGQGAQVTATCCTSGAVTGVNLIAGGSGYGSSPTCTISAAQGSGATCTATATSGVITAVNFGVGGSGYVADPTVTLSGGGSGATARADLNYCSNIDPFGCFFNNLGMTERNIGGGVDTNTSPATLVACWPEYWADANFTSDGLFISRSIDQGVSWSTPVQFSNNPPPQVNGANWNSCTGQLVVIPPGSYANSSCNSGCIAINVRDDTDGVNQIWFSFDDGQTWPTKQTILSETGISDETALMWAGGNKIIGFNRPSANTGQPMWFFQSTDLGTTWTKTSTNLPFINGGVCGSGSLVSDQHISPIIEIPSLAQANPTIATLIYSERQSCTGGSLDATYAVNFSPSTVTATLTAPQTIVPLAPANISLYGYPGAFQNGATTVYLWNMAPSGTTLSNAQNFTETLNYVLQGIAINGNTKFSGGVTFQ